MTGDWDDPRLDGPGVTAYPTQAELDEMEREADRDRPDPSELYDDRVPLPWRSDPLTDALQRSIDRDHRIRTYPKEVPF